MIEDIAEWTAELKINEAVWIIGYRHRWDNVLFSASPLKDGTIIDDDKHGAIISCIAHVLRMNISWFISPAAFETFGISLSNTGQVRIWRSSGRFQFSRSKKPKKFLKIVFPQCKTSVSNNTVFLSDTFCVREMPARCAANAVKATGGVRRSLLYARSKHLES